MPGLFDQNKPMTNTNIIDKIVGATIQRRRQQQNLTPEKFCFRAHLTPSQLADIEAGNVRLSASQIFRVADVLNITPRQLFAEVGQRVSNPAKWPKK